MSSLIQGLNPNTYRGTVLDTLTKNLVAAGQQRPIHSLADALGVQRRAASDQAVNEMQMALAKRRVDNQTQKNKLEQDKWETQQVAEATISKIRTIPNIQDRIPYYKELGSAGQKAFEEDLKVWDTTRQYGTTVNGEPRTVTEGFNAAGQLGILGSVPRSAGQNIEVNTHIPGEPRYGRINEKRAESLEAQQLKLEDTAIALKNLSESEKMLNDAIISGFGADWRLSFAKAANLVGANNEELIANTEAYMNSMGRQTAEIIKAFGSGTGLSDADREYAQGIAGGSIKISPKAMKKLINMAKKGYMNKLEVHNKKAKVFHDADTQGQLMGSYMVDYVFEPSEEDLDSIDTSKTPLKKAEEFEGFTIEYLD